MSYQHIRPALIDAARTWALVQSRSLQWGHGISAVELEALKQFSRWIFLKLQAEYEYLSENDTVDEAILCNGYTFTLSGEREG